MDKLADKVVETMRDAGLVEVEVSAKHVHLSTTHIEALFGAGAVLHEKRDLSQPGQYLSEERVNLIGPKGKISNVAVLGPARKDTQVELSLTDARTLGVKAPIAESGKLDGAGSITIEGPCGSVEAPGSVIIAHNHVHVPVDVAKKLNLENGEHVNVQVLSDRPLTFNDVIIRVSDKFRFRMHIDFDEANAAGVNGFTLGKILKK